MLSAFTSSRFPGFLLVSRVWDISSGIGPCFPLAGGLCKFYAKAGGKQPVQRQPSLSVIQAASQSTFINPKLPELSGGEILL
jgi:hypothetical protein